MNELIQLPDTANTDPTCVSCWCFDPEPGFLANGFLILDCLVSDTGYLAQVIAPQLNLNRDALLPTDPTSMNQLEAIQAGRFEREVAIKEAFLFTVKLLREIKADGSIGSIRRRPQIGARGRAATADELLRYLRLPITKNSACILGQISDTEVPIGIDLHTILHHILVSGATGAGKSNVIASTTETAVVALNTAVVIYDMKPDFQCLHEPNDEGAAKHYRGIENVSYWRIGVKQLGGDQRIGRYQETAIHIPASELDITILARSIFKNYNEAGQADTFEYLWMIYADEKNEVAPGSAYSLDEFVNWLPANTTEAKKRFNINVNNYEAVLRKVRRRNRRLSWVDGGSNPINAALSGRRIFDLGNLLTPGSVTVIRIASDAGGSLGYALFLNYVFQQIYQLKESGEVRCPVLNIVDEGQDLFPRGGGSAEFQNIVAPAFSENIRKGRSLGVATLLAVQSAERVPVEILDNLNSHIVLRHTQLDSVKRALPTATIEQAAMTLTFGPGEALVDLFGSTATVHCQLRRSPFRLHKPTEYGE